MIFDLKDGLGVVSTLLPYGFITGLRINSYMNRVRDADELIPEYVINDLSQDSDRGKQKMLKESIFFLNWMKDPL